MFGKKIGMNLDHVHAEFTHGNGLFGALIRNYSFEDFGIVELENAIWVQELKIVGKTPATKKPGKALATKTTKTTTTTTKTAKEAKTRNGTTTKKPAKKIAKSAASRAPKKAL